MNDKLMNITKRGVMAGFLFMAMALQGCATIANQHAAHSESTPLVAYGFDAAVELAPVHLAVRKLYGEGAVIHHGGVGDLAGPDHKGDVASNAEAPFLRFSAADPNLRIIMTIAEGHYPIVARRSAGIISVADLKGKRVMHSSIDMPTTSTFFSA